MLVWLLCLLWFWTRKWLEARPHASVAFFIELTDLCWSVSHSLTH
jgi:hypothetical protein